jgi:hypothetical protein
MLETVLERHYRDRVHSVREIALHETAQAIRSLQGFADLVTLCTDLSKAGRDLLENEYQRIFKEPDLCVTWLRERRLAIERLSENYLQLVQSIRSLAAHVEQPPDAPSVADLLSRLDGAIGSLAETKQSVLERWPVGSDLEIAAAQEAAIRGEGLDIDEAFAQVAGVDVDTWRQRALDFCRPAQE